MRALLDLVRARRGVAAVETGVVLAFLIVPLLSLTVGVGQGMLLQYRVDRALHAGLIYAWGTTGAAASPNTSAVQTAAQNGYGTAPPTMTAVASYACYCITETGTRATGQAKNCNASCGSGTTQAVYLTLTTTDTYTPIFTMNWGGGAWSISATATVRVPQ